MSAHVQCGRWWGGHGKRADAAGAGGAAERSSRLCGLKEGTGMRGGGACCGCSEHSTRATGPALCGHGACMSDLSGTGQRVARVSTQLSVPVLSVCLSPSATRPPVPGSGGRGPPAASRQPHPPPGDRVSRASAPTHLQSHHHHHRPPASLPCPRPHLAPHPPAISPAAPPRALPLCVDSGLRSADCG